jgi:hypothetical protein
MCVREAGMPRLIEDGDLQSHDWPAIWLFALTTDGYARLGSFEAVAQLGNAAAAAFEERGAVPQDLATLRLALFFEQRRYRHFDESPSGTAARYVRALVRAIGDAVAHAHSAEPPDTAAGAAEVKQGSPTTADEALPVEYPPRKERELSPRKSGRFANALRVATRTATCSLPSSTVRSFRLPPSRRGIGGSRWGQAGAAASQ